MTRKQAENPIFPERLRPSSLSVVPFDESVQGEPFNNRISARFGVGGRLSLSAQVIQPLDDLVEAGEAIADDLRRNLFRSRTYDPEHILRRVQRSGHGGKVDDSRGAFEGMKRSENAIEPVRVAGCFLQGQQVLRGLFHELLGFQKELVDELVHAELPHSRSTYSIKVSWLRGLTR